MIILGTIAICFACKCCCFVYRREMVTVIGDSTNFASQTHEEFQRGTQPLSAASSVGSMLNQNIPVENLPKVIYDERIYSTQ